MSHEAAENRDPFDLAASGEFMSEPLIHVDFTYNAGWQRVSAARFLAGVARLQQENERLRDKLQFIAEGDWERWGSAVAIARDALAEGKPA